MKPASLSDYPALHGLSGKTLMIYDGDCPFCTRFVAWQSLRASVGPVDMLNARDGGEYISVLWDAGYDFNEGMVLIWNDQIFHGDDCVHRLALLSSRSGVFNKLNSVIFKSPRISALLYPVLRTGRNITLQVIGRKRLSKAE